MGLPPLVISREDLRELRDLAGDDAELETSVHKPGSRDAREIVLNAPGVMLSLGSDARTTELAFDDEEKATARAERLLERLESCRRRSASFTHTDGAIFVGMIMPLAAGLLAPPSWTLRACGIASVFWMLYLVWAHDNARTRWCQFEDAS